MGDEMASERFDVVLIRINEYELLAINKWVWFVEVTVFRIEGKTNKRGLEWAKER